MSRLLVGLLSPALILTALGADNQLTPKEKKEGWILLFDGKSLDNWMSANGQPSKRPPEDDCINPHKSGVDVLVYKKQFENFTLATDFKLAPHTNTGLMLRDFPLEKPQGKDWGWNAIEIQIEDTPGNDYHTTGAIYDLVAPTKNNMKPAGEWNHIEVTCKRNIITVTLNGEPVTRGDLDTFTKSGLRPDGSETKFTVPLKDHPRNGYVGLQDHGGDCWFKNIKLKPLP